MAHAKKFLKLHGGRCTVLKDCQLGKDFRELARLKQVSVTHSSLPGYIDVSELQISLRPPANEQKPA